MANLKQMIEVAAAGEAIEAIVVGVHDSDVYRDGDKRPGEIANKVVSWETAAPVLDVEYDNGYGAADTFPITAWTASRVIFVHEYDGATGVNFVHRHPVDHKPSFGGE